jgi:hypothetical protein
MSCRALSLHVTSLLCCRLRVFRTGNYPSPAAYSLIPLKTQAAIEQIDFPSKNTF